LFDGFDNMRRGFIDRYTMDKLLAEGFEVIILGSLCIRNLENISHFLGISWLGLLRET
jgi:hypothetical protein